MRITLLFVLIMAWTVPCSAQLPDVITYEISYTYDDAGRLVGETVADRLTVTWTYDDAGNMTSVSSQGQSGVASEADADLPLRFALHPAYPNPFNPTSTVRIDVPRDAAVRLDLFDATGRLVRRIVDTRMAAGRHEQTIQPGAGGWSASGTYFLVMTTPDARFVQPLMLIK